MLPLSLPLSSIGEATRKQESAFPPQTTLIMQPLNPNFDP
jgi:hypothetical protein